MLSLMQLERSFAVVQKEALDRIKAICADTSFIQGQEVRDFEKNLQDFTSLGNAVTVNSGTDALILGLLALGVRPGDEVITSNFTFGATVNAILAVGATPVLADVVAGTSLISVETISPLVTRKTKAVICVDMFGHPCDYENIKGFCSQKGLFLVQDAAQSFGSTIGGQSSHKFVDVACVSFFPTKPLGGAGDGGCILTQDDSIAERCRQIASQGQSKKKKYSYELPGLNSRLDSIQAAFLNCRIEHFSGELVLRQRAFEMYVRELADIEQIKPILPSTNGSRSANALFSVFASNRDGLMDYLSDRAIQTAIYYPEKISEQKAYRENCIFLPDYPNTNSLIKSVLSLPFGPYIRENEIVRVCREVASYYEGREQYGS